MKSCRNPGPSPRRRSCRRLDGHAHGGGRRVGPEAGGHLAAGAEAGVQTAVGVVTRHGEVVIERVRIGDRARHDDLAAGLDRHAGGGGRNVVAEAGEDLAAGAEARVQLAAGVVARHREVLEEVVAAIEARDRPRHHDPAVRIDGHARGGGRRIAAEAR